MEWTKAKTSDYHKGWMVMKTKSMMLAEFLREIRVTVLEETDPTDLTLRAERYFALDKLAN